MVAQDLYRYGNDVLWDGMVRSALQVVIMPGFHLVDGAGASRSSAMSTAGCGQTTAGRTSINARKIETETQTATASNALPWAVYIRLGNETTLTAAKHIGYAYKVWVSAMTDAGRGHCSIGTLANNIVPQGGPTNADARVSAIASLGTSTTAS